MPFIKKGYLSDLRKVNSARIIVMDNIFIKKV